MPYKDSYNDEQESSEPSFPCCYSELAPGDIAYDQGFRFSVEDLTGEHYWFTQEERSDAFIDREGFYCVTRAEMKKLRNKEKIKMIPYTEEQFFDEMLYDESEDMPAE